MIMRLLLLTVAMLVSLPGKADPQSKSFSSWHFNDHQASAVYTIAHREVTRLPGYRFNPDFNEVIAEHIHATVALSNNGELCELSSLLPQRAATGYSQLQLNFECQQRIDKTAILIATLLDAAPSHVHFAKFQRSNGSPFELLFTRRAPSHTIYLNVPGKDVADTGVGDTLLTYVIFGFEHILIGIDHIAFLLTLMLLARGLRDILWMVTGFTLGHSLTLSLAVLGWVTPNTMVVESMIGFTIALVAIENIACQSRQAKQAALVTGCGLGLLLVLSVFSGGGPPLLSLLGLALFSYCYLSLSHTKAIALRLRPLITLGFGLIHGFGFAGVLMEVGLPVASILPALFGFNIGVELGQIVIVMLIGSLGAAAVKLLPADNIILSRELLSASLCGLGTFWFVQRAWF